MMMMMMMMITRSKKGSEEGTRLPAGVKHRGAAVRDASTLRPRRNATPALRLAPPPPP